jgi:hypothetical protein
LKNHATRYASKWDVSKQEARRRLIAYGWSIDGLTTILEEAELAGSCPKENACGWPWDFGQHEMTIDVKDPDAVPMFPQNVWVICRTCNGRKRKLRLSEWQEFLAYWRWLVNPDSPPPGQLAIDDVG